MTLRYMMLWDSNPSGRLTDRRIHERQSAVDQQFILTLDSQVKQEKSVRELNPCPWEGMNTSYNFCSLERRLHPRAFVRALGGLRSPMKTGARPKACRSPEGPREWRWEGWLADRALNPEPEPRFNKQQ